MYSNNRLCFERRIRPSLREAKVQEVLTFLAGAKLDLITVIFCFMYAVHRRWLVLGREYDREVARGDKLETALQSSNDRELKTNEVNAKMAGLVPDLLKLSVRSGETHHADSQEG